MVALVLESRARSTSSCALVKSADDWLVTDDGLIHVPESLRSGQSLPKVSSLYELAPSPRPKVLKISPADPEIVTSRRRRSAVEWDSRKRRASVESYLRRRRASVESYLRRRRASVE